MSHSLLIFDYWKRLFKELTGSKAFPNLGNLTNEELLAIYGYTDFAYYSLNSHLHGGSLDWENTMLDNALRSGLSKLPNYEGACYRRTTWSYDAREGETITFNSYTSFTSDQKVLDRYEGNTYFIIRQGSTSGRDISGFSKNPDEMEVLFLPGTIFEVIRVTRIGEETFYEICCINI